MVEILQGKKFKCAFCKGTGVQPRSLKSRCLPCRGKGEVEFEGPAITCPSCKGTGRSPGTLGLSCIRCKGVGVIEKREAGDALGERLGEITKRLSGTRKEAEKKTKEIKKRLKPVKPFIKEVKKETAWFENLGNNLRKQSKEGVGVSLETITKRFFKGIGGLLGFAANLEAQGKDEYVEQGEINGKTKSGKEYKSAYGFRVKVGLNPEEFRGQKKLPSESPKNKK